MTETCALPPARIPGFPLVSAAGFYLRAVEGMVRAGGEPLREANVPIFDINVTGAVGLAQVTAEPGGLFSETGRIKAMVLPVIDGAWWFGFVNSKTILSETIVDVIAFDVTAPSRVLRKIGAGHLLGELNLFAGLENEDEPLKVYETPLSWLRGGGAGIHILDWDAARVYLGQRQAFAAETPQLGERLESALKPRVLVRRDSARRSA